MKISEQLLQCAAEVRKGWCQNALIDNHGNVCAIGAMSRVLCGQAEGNCNRLPLMRYLWRSIGSDTTAYWNNAPGQTQENVAQAFELAAILAEQDEARIGVSETMPECVEAVGVAR